jgi:putative aldouronate transport system substrate-binding protein
LFKSVSQTPGSGGEFTAIVPFISAAPKPMEGNAAWQEINKQLGVTANLNLIAVGDYPAKLPAVIASGTLPDLMYGLDQYVPNTPDLLNSACQDLTAHLSGDAVKDYPNLANLPTLSWRSTVFNDAIYGIPLPRPPIGSILMYRRDIWAQAGVNPPATPDELMIALKSLTNPSAQRWGIATYVLTNFGLGNFGSGSLFGGMFGAPNNWRLESSGKLTKDYETEQFKAAVGFLADLWKAGVFHPDTANMSPPTGDQVIWNGTVATTITTWGDIPQSWPLQYALNPIAQLDALPPIALPGAKPTYPLANGTFGMNYIRKNDPERVKMLLRVLNFLAAPFGSEEWALVSYGIPDVDYKLDANGNPAPTEQGKAEITVPWRFLTNTAPVLFDPNKAKEFATTTYAAQKAYIAAGVPDPVVGFYSPTNSKTGFPIARTLLSGLVDIVVGRRPLSGYDQLVSDWRSGGGDQIRVEFQQAMAAVK